MMRTRRRKRQKSPPLTTRCAPAKKRPLVLAILVLLVILVLAILVGLIALVVWAVVAIVHAATTGCIGALPFLFNSVK